MSLMKDYYKNYCTKLSEALKSIDEDILLSIFNIIDEARRNDKSVFVLGNGGSASNATHWVCDFVKGASVSDKKRIKMYALSDNTGTVTAYSNDFSYEDVFVEQLKNFAGPGDVIISMSVSGSSPNLVKANKYCQSIGCKCISIIGDNEGKLLNCSDITVKVSSKNYGVVEDSCMIIGHIFSQYLKHKLLSE